MLEGLEVSEIDFRTVKNEKRIDSEYYKKFYLSFFKNVNNIRPLSEFVSDGYRVVYENTQILNKQDIAQDNYPFFLQATDLSTPFIDTTNMKYVDAEEWDRYPKGRVKRGELLIEVKGKAEKVSIVPDDFPERTLISGSLFKLTVNGNISKYTLLCYLISKYGTAFKERFKTNLLISFISKPDLYRIPVPVFQKELNDQIDSIFETIILDKKKSEELYLDAEKILLKELGLLNWQPNNDNTSIKRFIDFIVSGRFDAEFYQPKYDELEAIIKKYPNKTIAGIQTFNARGVQPDYLDDGEIPVVNSKHILEDGLDYDNFEHTTKGFLGSHERAKICYGDILIYTTGANIGRAQVYLKKEPAVASNYVNILRVQGVNPVYLAIVLNSQVGRMQTEKLCTGSAQAELYPTDIEKFVVPILPDKTQQIIADYVKKSVSLRQQAKQLLEDAKLKVETAITGGVIIR